MRYRLTIDILADDALVAELERAGHDCRNPEGVSTATALAAEVSSHWESLGADVSVTVERLPYCELCEENHA